jgi:glycine oxidase
LVIAGSTEEEVGFSEEVDWARLRELEERAGALFSPLREATPDLRWWGFRPATRDGRPVLRRRDERVVLAYGHYRNGILLAPWTAREAATILLG